MPFCSVLRASCRSCYWRIPGLRSLTQARHALGSFAYNPWPALFWESIRDLNGDHHACLKKREKGPDSFYGVTGAQHVRIGKDLEITSSDCPILQTRTLRS